MGVDETKLQHIRRGALLHDIGKVGIPDSILLKQDALTPEEWEMMKMHPVYSYELLRSISYLLPAIDIPHFHHEKWDGTGYPLGLKGEAIPQAARLFAVVDVWDALRSARPYRAAWSDSEVRAYLRNNSGTHFDPVVVDIFLKMMEVNNPDWALNEIVIH
jgi:HD-GYP domain-containing protein (c-di-GMP phosphodiesterase class II)